MSSLEDTGTSKDEALDKQGANGDHDLNMEKTQASATPGRVAPDGGLAAWLTVLGAWCTSVCSFGWLNSMATPNIPI